MVHLSSFVPIWQDEQKSWQLSGPFQLRTRSRLCFTGKVDSGGRHACGHEANPENLQRAIHHIHYGDRFLCIDAYSERVRRDFANERKVASILSGSWIRIERIMSPFAWILVIKKANQAYFALALRNRSAPRRHFPKDSRARPRPGCLRTYLGCFRGLYGALKYLSCMRRLIRPSAVTIQLEAPVSVPSSWQDAQ